MIIKVFRLFTNIFNLNLYSKIQWAKIENIDFFDTDLIQTADVKSNPKPIKIFSFTADQYICVTKWVTMIWQLPFQFFSFPFLHIISRCVHSWTTTFQYHTLLGQFLSESCFFLPFHYIFYWKYLLMWSFSFYFHLFSVMGDKKLILQCDIFYFDLVILR